ncbi:MAG: hypothetical protein HPY66_0249 [Firmicutes bacterium]|nr:hypothetical protein [Bacillota bacterium]MDI6704671.1 flagellar hook-length control protein FliK [Bacillota bacterium]
MDVRELLVPTTKEAVLNSKTSPKNDAKKATDGSPFSSLFADIMQKNNSACPKDETMGEQAAKASRLAFAPALLAGLNLMDLASSEMPGDHPVSEEDKALDGASVMMANRSIQISKEQTTRQELFKATPRSDRDEAIALEEGAGTIPVVETDAVPAIVARQKGEPLEMQDGFTVEGRRSIVQSKRVFNDSNNTEEEVIKNTPEEEVIKNTPEGKVSKDAVETDLADRMKAVYQENENKPPGKEERITDATKTRGEIKNSIEFNPASKPEVIIETGDNKTKALQKNVIDTEKTEFTVEVVEKVKVMVNSKRSEVSVQLKPESLGKMSFKLEVVNGVLNGRITVHNNQAREVLQANLNQLRDNLEQSGIPVSKLTVNIGSHGEFRQHQYSQENRHDQDGYTGRWVVPGYRGEEAEETFRWNDVGTVEYLA